MTVKALKAVFWQCEECRHGQYGNYTLEHSWHEDRAVMADNIICETCGHENHVIEEL